MIEHPNPSPDETADVETRLRQCAPALPVTLRSRTLGNVASRAAARQERQNRLQRRFSWAIAGVLTIQWLTLFVVDAQNTHLIAGNSEPPPFASVSVSQINELWHQRSRELAQWMKPNQIG